MQSFLPRVRIEPGEKGVFDPLSMFEKTPAGIWLEIGFGAGEHLAELAEQNPGNGYLGCEPFINGVASLLARIDRRKIANVRVFPDDARVLLKVLPVASLDGCFLLYPDPWPKKRHAKRRFVNAENLDLLARVLKPGAELLLATDAAALAEWMRGQIDTHPDFSVVYDENTPPGGWVETRYEKKGARAGRVSRYIVAERRKE